MIGAERNSAIQPSRSTPTNATRMPTMTARMATFCAYCALPARARWATPAAKSGAMVESAPTDICGLEPRRANDHGAGHEGVEAGDRWHPGQL